MEQFQSPSQPKKHSLIMQLLNEKFTQYEHNPQGYLAEIIEKQNIWPDITTEKIIRFLSSLSELYNNVPYHNLTHAFDVTTILDQYLINFGMMERLQISKQERVYMLIAAYAHDNGHEGHRNNYYIQNKLPLAIEYPVSPLENMHASNLIASFRANQIEISTENQKMMVAMILKTDNIYHQKMLKTLAQKREILKTDPIKEEDKSFMIETLLHLADINNPSKQTQIFLRWTNRLYAQYDKQVAFGLFQYQNESALLLYKSNQRYLDSNIQFIGHMILPIYKEISSIFTSFSILYDGACKNMNQLQAMSNQKPPEKIQQKQHEKSQQQDGQQLRE